MATPRGPILTQADRELAGAPRGIELAAGVAQRMRDRAPTAEGTYVVGQAIASDMTWGDFQQRHPEWRGDYWAECRALYAGGDKLLGDKAVLERLFPMHMHEAANIYEERKKRAHYYPYAGTIIDHLLAGLGTDPLRCSFAIVDDKGVQTLPSEAKWWESWICDVTDTAERPSDYGLEDDDDEDDDEGGCNVHTFCVDVLREALQTRTAWVLADLPAVDPDAPAPVIDSALAAEQHGLHDPYLCVVPAEQVIDWQTDEKGRILWAIVMTQEQIRETPKQRRGSVRHTFVLWDDVCWTKYQIDVDPSKLPSAETPVPMIGQPTLHGFGRVPIERLVLPEGLYAMGKLHSLAREHLNKRCAMSWAEYKSLYAVLYEFLGPEDANGLPVAQAQTDGGRATNQIRGQGWTQVRGKDDDARFVGPEVAPFKEARESCNDAMREMHRVMFSMALSANMDSAALTRSGDSKAQDSATTAVLLDAFGQIVRRFYRRLLVLAALGRGEAPPKCRVEGLEQFDVTGTAAAITEAVELLNGVPILSPLFRELYLARVYTKVLGDVDPKQAATIRQQIREAISNEQAAIEGGLIPGIAPGGPAPKPGDKAQQPDPDPEDEGEDGGGEDKPPPAKPQSGYSSSRKKR